MKKNIIILLSLFSLYSSAQIALSYTHTGIRGVTKLDYAGYKSYSINAGTESIDIFEADNSLYKSIAVPGFTGTVLTEIYLSDNLFDTDSLIEYFVTRQTGNTESYEIYNEEGNVLFSRANCGFQNFANGAYHMDIFNNNHLIFYDGVSTKMRIIHSGAYEVYELPGRMPCIECNPDPGVYTGFKSSKAMQAKEATFFPNPVKSELKLKYSIPPATKTAKIKIYDMNGRLVGDYRISSATDYILLPSDYNNGLYLYSLEIDGLIIKNQKVVLDKY